MRFVREDGSPLEYTPEEQEVIDFARKLETAYFRYYQKHLRILPRKPIPGKGKYWKLIARILPKLKDEGITDYELYCFSVIEEFHRQKGDDAWCFPTVILSDAGLWYYRQSRKHLTVPVQKVQPKEEVHTVKLHRSLLHSPAVQEFLRRRGILCEGGGDGE